MFIDFVDMLCRNYATIPKGDHQLKYVTVNRRHIIEGAKERGLPADVYVAYFDKRIEMIDESRR